MCGRLNIIDDPLATMVSKTLGLSFSVESNTNLAPSQKVATIIKQENTLQQLDTHWGIKPNWAKKLLINAQSESVASKPTFKHSFAHYRCLVPCNGWYEWKTQNSAKIKYYFDRSDKEPLYMAGIFYPNGETNELVTLTTQANQLCQQYHHRMPVLISPEHINMWFDTDSNFVRCLFTPNNEWTLKVSECV